MKEDNKPYFAFEKQIGVADHFYGDIPTLLNLIGKLLYCMKETNQLHEVECEFFRLDFRQPYFDEMMKFPRGSLILDMKFGSKNEFNEKINENEVGLCEL